MYKLYFIIYNYSNLSYVNLSPHQLSSGIQDSPKFCSADSLQFTLRERVNRRVRPVVDGLVAARWHTCGANLRNVYDRLKGRPTPGFCRPRTLALRAHNAASFAIITSLLSPPRGSNEVPSSLFIVRSSSRSFLPLCISFFFFCNLPCATQSFRSRWIQCVDNEISPG